MPLNEQGVKSDRYRFDTLRTERLQGDAAMQLPLVQLGINVKSALQVQGSSSRSRRFTEGNAEPVPGVPRSPAIVSAMAAAGGFIACTTRTLQILEQVHPL
ncbi:hypothetical protein [Tibeticola sp.]|uniref:hypothetical protein n=1 Tax=Tibeticola sp. TaxID=2005368 RepID=UPI002587CB3E|nr:hypothetical protein [Tibeticola sp.]MCI4440398.1 hypothetical protein [Tibeticola sp.]